MTGQCQVLDKNFDIAGAIPTKLKVFLALINGLSINQTAKELRITKQAVYYHALRLLKSEWIKSIGGKNPLLFGPGPKANQGHRRLASFNNTMSVISKTDWPQYGPSTGALTQGLKVKGLLGSAYSLTLTCRIHNHRATVPVMPGSAPWRTIKESISEAQDIDMGRGGVVRHRFRFEVQGRALQLELMSRTLIVYFPEVTVRTLPELLTWKVNLSGVIEELAKELDKELGLRIDPKKMEVCEEHYAFPDLGKSKDLEALGTILFESPEAWVDCSKGPEEWEVNSFRLALLQFSLPLLVGLLIEKTQIHDTKIENLREEVDGLRDHITKEEETGHDQ